MKWGCLFLAEETEFAGGAFGPEVVGEMEVGAGSGGYGRVVSEAAERKEAGGLVEAEASAELTGGGAEDAATEGGVESAKTIEFDGDVGLGLAGSCADGAAASADGLAGEKELGEDAAEFGLPAGFFFAG